MPRKKTKPWDYGSLKVTENKRYLCNGYDDSPFFWLGDTAWLLFCKTDMQEASVYLRDRQIKGFNVIQSCLVYAAREMQDINKMHVLRYDADTEDYWKYCDYLIATAEFSGMYMALLPCWGSIVKNGILNMSNVERYADFLAERYGKKKNIIWLLGGDIKADKYKDFYVYFAHLLKEGTDNQLIGFHPFGRCSSSQWFADEKDFDFNMFQSGHRRYDQQNLRKWDDNSINDIFYGEDNWRYVLRDHKLSDKPTLDGEPSYEWILQGLHDDTQPYWKARDVRRYAYWSVFAGACGHTYGDNSVMQFYKKGSDTASYGAKDSWAEALQHTGSGQMTYLKKLMLTVDFTMGRPRDDLLIDGQQSGYDRIAVFAGENFLLAYNYTGSAFRIDLRDYKHSDLYYFIPSTGIFSYAGRAEDDFFLCKPPKTYGADRDYVLAVYPFSLPLTGI